MSGGDNFVITVGNCGAIVALHGKDKIKNKIFLDELNEDSKKELANLFLFNKKAPIYILFDTINQIYRKKIYPAVKKSDLVHVIKRDMEQDEDKESLKNYILLNKKITAARRWECLFVSFSGSKVTDDWIEFLLDRPNYLVGIYMLPIETFSLFNLIKSNIRLNSRIILKRNDLYCFILQNKVNGVRQIVFSEVSIVFTRIVNYDFGASDFLEKYEQDLYSTFEYLKRLFPELIMGELDIINILPKEVIDKIKTIDNVELNFVNYTPSQAAIVAGFKGVVADNSGYCDLVISRIFIKSRHKILKFFTPKIKNLQKFFYIFKFSKYLNICLSVVICVIGLNILIANQKFGSLISAAEKQKQEASDDLQKIKSSEIDGKSLNDVDIDQIIDMGKIHEALDGVGFNFIDAYQKLSIIKNYNVALSSFVYDLSNFNSKAENKNLVYKIDINGQIYNKSGDTEDLFREFDGMIVSVKQVFNKNQVKYTELPRNIDFAKKYYDSPVQITIDNQMTNNDNQ